MDEIRFYRASDEPYGPLSNLYRRRVEFEGEEFATSEHAYQAGKARRPAVRRWLMEAPSPALLAMAAHGLYWDVAPGWSTSKFDRMRAVLRAKFTQHRDLRELLLSTGDARLVESATVTEGLRLPASLKMVAERSEATQERQGQWAVAPGSLSSCAPRDDEGVTGTAMLRAVVVALPAIAPLSNPDQVDRSAMCVSLLV